MMNPLRNLKILGKIIAGAAFLFLAFQNCQNAKYGIEGVGGPSDSALTGQNVVDSAPTIEVTQSPGPFTKDPSPEISVTGMDDLGNVNFVCAVDNKPVDCANGTVHLPILPNGSHTVTIVGTDNNSQSSEPAVVSFVVDTTLPIVSITKKPSATTTVVNADIEFVGSDSGSGLQGFKCKLDNSKSVDCESPIAMNNLALGPHHFEVVAMDKAGNLSAPAVVNWVINGEGHDHDHDHGHDHGKKNHESCQNKHKEHKKQNSHHSKDDESEDDE